MQIIMLNTLMCPGRHLYSLCPGVPVVICVPMSRCVISSINKHDVSRHTNMTSLDTDTQTTYFYIYRCPGVPVVIWVPMSRCVISSIKKHYVSRHTNMTSLDTHTQTTYFYIYRQIDIIWRNRHSVTDIKDIQLIYIKFL